MDVRTYRARTMQEALSLVRRDLGPQAAVLHTRTVRGGRLWRWVPGVRQIEVTASTAMAVPCRLPLRNDGLDLSTLAVNGAPQAGFRDVQDQLTQLQDLVQDLCRRTHRSAQDDWPEELFRIFTDLIEADVAEDLARELVERVRGEMPRDALADPAAVRRELLALVEADIQVAGPIQLVPGQRRVVALVGQTGVGKTTTIAKLAANFRLREKRKVGLITVDTYRVAAVEQLRTYAEIIDLPMQVVTTPREMRQAVEGMAGLDLVLLDTAGRSPHDEVRLQELKSFVTDAGADEVHLVVSSVAGSNTLRRTVEQFAAIGPTALLLTKLDEASGLGHVLPLLRSCRLPLSYLTDGQVVPDDIRPADRGRLARAILGMDD